MKRRDVIRGHVLTYEMKTKKIENEDEAKQSSLTVLLIDWMNNESISVFVDFEDEQVMLKMKLIWVVHRFCKEWESECWKNIGRCHFVSGFRSGEFAIMKRLIYVEIFSWTIEHWDALRHKVMIPEGLTKDVLPPVTTFTLMWQSWNVNCVECTNQPLQLDSRGSSPSHGSCCSPNLG